MSYYCEFCDLSSNGLRCPKCNRVCKFSSNKSYNFSDFSVDEALSQTTKQNGVYESDNKIHSTDSNSQSSDVTVESSQSPLPAIILVVIIFVGIVPEAGFFVLVGAIGIFLIWFGDQGPRQPNQNVQHSVYLNRDTGKVEHIFHKGDLTQKHLVRTNQQEPNRSEHLYKIK